MNLAVAKLDKSGINIKYPDIQALVAAYGAANTACASFFIPTPVTFGFTCNVGGTAPNSYPTYQAAWASQSQSCDAIHISGTEYTEQQTNALNTAYGAGYSRTALNTLYSLCAEINGYISDPKPSDGSGRLSTGQAAEASGALVLCPDHPQATGIQAKVDAVGVAAAAVSSQAQAVSDGTFANPGKYLVGPDIQPGTWQSVGDKVTDCYWEISDPQGEIIDNNFISIAPQLTIQIPADAAGFTATNCSFQRIGD